VNIILPIVAREMRVASRRGSTYWGRVATATLTLGMLLWLMFVMIPQLGIPPTRFGGFLFRGLFLVALVMGCLSGVAGTADSISREKRDGTLGLLFLTDLRGYDIVLGKLAATALSTLYRLLAVVPLLGISLQLGGVTSQDMIEAAVILVVGAGYAMSAGMLVSVLSRHERKAMFATLFFLVFLAGFPFLAAYVMTLIVLSIGGPWSTALQNQPQVLFHWLALSPLYPVLQLVFRPMPAPIAALALQPAWLSVAFMVAPSGMFLWTAGALLPRIWRRSDRIRTGNRASRMQDRLQDRLAFGPGPVRTAWRRRLLEINPFLWLNLRERGKRWYAWFYFSAVTLTWWWGLTAYGDLMFDAGPGAPGLWLIQAFMKVWIVSESCSRLAEDRRAGTLELILSTPLTVREIIRGQWLALRRQFALPVAALVLVIGSILGRMFTGWVGVVFGVVFLLDLVACAWVGFWLALSERSLGLAWQRTFALVLVLPWFLTVGAMFLVSVSGRATVIGEHSQFIHAFLCWAGAGVAVDIGLGLIWARRRLIRDFRQVATETLRPETGAANWLARLLEGGRRRPNG
jgi:ABC-type Na+ efflux pump permease subunit